jgi:hypothetical protein
MWRRAVARNPSEVTDDFWIRASAPENANKDVTKSGKWMLFTPGDARDEVWAKIRTATEAGDLGYAAKAATARSNALSVSPRVLLTCVYTYDCEDQSDVTPVLVGLRELGFAGRLSYKSDAATLEGTYGSGSAMYVAQPGSLDIGERRR